MNTTAAIAAGTLSPAMPLPNGMESRNATAVSGQDTSTAASPEPQISPTARALAELCNTTSEAAAAASGARAQTLSRLLEHLTDDGSKFATLAADRFKPMTVAAFTDNDKKLLGEAYRLASGNEEDMQKLDTLAGKLGALRIHQRLNGELIASLASTREDLNEDGKVNVDDTPYEVETAHLAILGEMMRLAEKNHMTIELFF